MAAATGTIGGMPVKKRLRFREEDDLALLREVAGQNPFVNPKLWDVIKQHVLLLTGKEFTLKTLKDHLDLLIKLWLEKTKVNTFKSGTEEDYSEKEQLCQDIYDAMIQFRNNKSKKKVTKKKAAENAGKLSRDTWANNALDLENGDIGDNTMNVSDHDIEYCDVSVMDERKSNVAEKEIVEVPPSHSNRKFYVSPLRARKRKINTQRQGLAYLEQYDKNQFELKKQDQVLEEKRFAVEERKIALEERKMKLAEKRFELDEYERKKNLQILEDRFASELQQKKDMTKIIERQDKIIEMLILQIQKYK